MKKDLQKELFLLLTGTIIALIGFKYFIFPLALNQSGVSGIAFMFAKYNQATIESNPNLFIFNIIYVGLNIPLILFSWFKIGKKFVVYSAITILLVPVILSTLPSVEGLLNVLENKLLATIFGAALVGIGTANIYKSGGCPGGTDFISMYVSKHKPKIQIAKINLFFAFSIMITSQIILTNKFNLPILNETFFYTLVFFAIVQFIIDRMFPRHNIIKTTVITPEPKKVIAIIKEHFPHKGYSKYQVTGSRQTKKEHIDILLSYYESKEFVEKIREEEIPSFAYTTKLYNVHGAFTSKK